MQSKERQILKSNVRKNKYSFVDDSDDDISSPRITPPSSPARNDDGAEPGADILIAQINTDDYINLNFGEEICITQESSMMLETLAFVPASSLSEATLTQDVIDNEENLDRTYNVENMNSERSFQNVTEQKIQGQQEDEHRGNAQRKKQPKKPSYEAKMAGMVNFTNSAGQYYEACTAIRKTELEMAKVEHNAKMRAMENKEERKEALFKQTMKLENLRVNYQLLQQELIKRQLSYYTEHGGCVDLPGSLPPES